MANLLLKSTEKINIVVDEKDLAAANPNLKVIYNGRQYSGISPYRCESNPDKRPLYGYIVTEFLDNKKSACDMFEKLCVERKKETPAPQQSSFGSKLEEIMLQVLAEQSIDKVMETAKPMLEKYIADNFGMLPQKHEVITPKMKHEFEGVTHECFDKVLNLVNLDVPVFLSGPAGTGKNVICKQVAEALGLDFYFTNAVTQEYQLKGFIDANGTYHETQFFKAFTQGGLFFLDEMDGSIPETLIILNAAIANRYFDFPTGKFEAHPNFRIIAAGNTVGTGADIEYTGRFQLDASSLDRFALIFVDYSPAIENSITNGNTELCGFAKAFRQVVDKAGIRCLCTYRAMSRIAMLESVFDLDEVLKMSLTKGLTKDDITIIRKGFKDINFFNKYVEALKG